jgi:transcriptional regulator with XRE-family HTH domain
MIFFERLKELRKEKNWSQQELADKIGGDARQISRYENKKITPSVEAVIKLAYAFNISIDYLLIENAPKRTLNNEDKEVIEKLQHIQYLSKEDKASLLHIVDALASRNKLKSFIQEL